MKITTLPAHGTLTMNGFAVTAGQFILINDLATGRLQYVPAADDLVLPYAAFTFQVEDDGGTAGGGVDLDPTPNTLTFNVVSVNPGVNHPPSGADQTVTTVEDTAYTVSIPDFGFTDANDSPQNNFLAVRITTLPIHGMLTGE